MKIPKFSLWLQNSFIFYRNQFCQGIFCEVKPFEITSFLWKFSVKAPVSWSCCRHWGHWQNLWIECSAGNWVKAQPGMQGAIATCVAFRTQRSITLGVWNNPSSSPEIRGWSLPLRSKEEERKGETHTQFRAQINTHVQSRIHLR